MHLFCLQGKGRFDGKMHGLPCFRMGEGKGYRGQAQVLSHPGCAAESGRRRRLICRIVLPVAHQGHAPGGELHPDLVVPPGQEPDLHFGDLLPFQELLPEHRIGQLRLFGSRIRLLSDPAQVNQLEDIFSAYWKDSSQAWEMTNDGHYRRRVPIDEDSFNAQESFIHSSGSNSTST